MLCLISGFKIKGSQPPYPPPPHSHRWDKNLDPPIPKPTVVVKPEHVRRGDIVRLQIIASAPDYDVCQNFSYPPYSSPCSFPQNTAINQWKIEEWILEKGEGTFGRLNSDGSFVPESDPTKITHFKTADNFIGYVSIKVKVDDIPYAIDPATGQKIETCDDDPVVSDPTKFTVWEFEIDPPYIDARPVDQLREGEPPYVFTATFRPGIDHNGNSMVSQIEFRLSSSREPGFCINATRVEGQWTDTTANDNDLKFIPNQSGLIIYASEGTNYDQAIYNVPQPPPSVVSTSVRVICLDYGAHGYLSAYARGVPSVPSPSVFVRWKDTLIEGSAQIPKDQKNFLDDDDGDGKIDEDPIDGKDNDGDGRVDEDAKGNGIWDGWEHEGRATDDDDNEPQGDGTSGDGLSRYEEYRGVMVFVREAGEGVTYDPNAQPFWTETSPRRKDLFAAVHGFRRIIQNEATAGYFPGAGMPSIHLISLAMFDNDLFQVNVNAGAQCPICQISHRVQNVYAAFIFESPDEVPDRFLGRTSSHIWSPRVTCTIYTRAIQRDANLIGVSEVSLLFHVVGHELGHTIICPLADGHVGTPPPDCGHHPPNDCLMEVPFQGIRTEFCAANPGCQRLWRLKRQRQ